MKRRYWLGLLLTLTVLVVTPIIYARVFVTSGEVTVTVSRCLTGTAFDPYSIRLEPGESDIVEFEFDLFNSCDEDKVVKVESEVSPDGSAVTVTPVTGSWVVPANSEREVDGSTPILAGEEALDGVYVVTMSVVQA